MDLNHRPLPYQGSALTELSYRPQNNRRLNVEPPDETTATAAASTALGEGHLDTTDEVRAHVVDEGGQRRESGQQDHVDEADHERDAEDAAEAQPGRHSAAALGSLDVAKE